MRIVNLSYVSIKEYDRPESWLKRINYFTGILEAMSLEATVINFHSIRYKGILTRNGVEYHFKQLSIFQRWFPFAFHSYMLGLKPDVIIVHGLLFPWQVLLLQWQRDQDVKIFIQHHAERPLKGLRNFLQRKADQQVEGYFFSSRELGLEWVRRKLISNEKRIYEVMEVSSVFSPVMRDHARQRTLVSGSVVYLWVGGLTTNKDPLTAVKAFRQFLVAEPSAELYLIYHSTELLKQIKDFLSNGPGLGKSIHMIGEIPRDEMGLWFCSADYIISSSHYEGSGTAICEAMSCGCIPILSDIPSFRMMTANGSCGFLFPPGNNNALAEVLQKSLIIDRGAARTRVLEQFRTTLSFGAIARQILLAINKPRNS